MEGPKSSKMSIKSLYTCSKVCACVSFISVFACLFEDHYFSVYKLLSSGAKCESKS